MLFFLGIFPIKAESWHVSIFVNQSIVFSYITTINNDGYLLLLSKTFIILRKHYLLAFTVNIYTFMWYLQFTIHLFRINRYF